MAVHNKTNAVLNINCQRNKVYINPNFSRPQLNNLPNNATVHVNPKFSHFVSNSQSNVENKNKIYVNPNFKKSRSVDGGNQCVTTSSRNTVVSDKISYTNNSLTTYEHQPGDKEAMALPVPVAQSRYCLVRQNVTNKPFNVTMLKGNNTIKINKYKTISWKDIKRNLDNVKNVTSNNMTLSETNFRTPTIENGFNSFRKNNKFKLINNSNSVSLLKQERTKSKLLDVQKLFKSNQVIQSRLKKIKGNLKKNNIPCPLFRKFGKCLRNVRWNCEFLHDRKHVSICRKFLKGLCHDKDCLLSHDLTTKKMPTCYFYLQGTCTKANCPYLHVKLNEKTKICPDFLKGYCEKGSKCLQRHINLTTERKKLNPQNRVAFRKKHKEPKIHEVDMKNSKYETKKVLQKIKTESDESPYPENRYYEEHRANTSTDEYEIIKPMRCKLGTLPSFIQL